MESFTVGPRAPRVVEVVPFVPYQPQNKAKASFDDIYAQPTPHGYIAEMAVLGYQIGEQARPYCTAAAELLSQRIGDAWPVHMLDVGCSYGIGSAFVKFGCSFDELVAFFATRAPTDYGAVCEAMRAWLHITPPVCDVRCVGLDASAPAIGFAVDAGLLDGGITANFELPNAEPPTREEIGWFRSCNLVIGTGAIGYVTERTFDVVLPHLGRDHPGEAGPLAVFTVLRMFETDAMAACFARHGLSLRRVEGIRLPQRRFADEAERDEVLALLRGRDIDTTGWEDGGRYYADLFVGARPGQIDELVDLMRKTRRELAAGQSTTYIRR